MGPTCHSLPVCVSVLVTYEDVKCTDSCHCRNLHLWRNRCGKNKDIVMQNKLIPSILCVFLYICLLWCVCTSFTYVVVGLAVMSGKLIQPRLVREAFFVGRNARIQRKTWCPNSLISQPCEIFWTEVCKNGREPWIFVTSSISGFPVHLSLLKTLERDHQYPWSSPCPKACGQLTFYTYLVLVLRDRLHALAQKV